MILDPDQCYRALRTHDARFDGRFFVGVGTTGIYCRPVCTAKTPLERNCRFFPSAAAAEGEGFRPCLRCRPELAPGYAIGRRQPAPRPVRGRADRGRAAGGGEPRGPRRHAGRHRPPPAPRLPAGVRRLARGLRADAAPAARQAPAHRHRAARPRRGDGERLREPAPLQRPLPHPLPHDAGRAAQGGPGARRGGPARLRPRPTARPTTGPPCWPSSSGARIAGVEAVDGRRYRRTIRLERAGKAHAGWIEVAPSPRKSALRVTASASLAGAVPALLARVKPLLDLASRPDEIAAALGPLAEAHPGLRLPGAVDGFEVAVRAILGQQVTVAAATTIAGRFAGAFGERDRHAARGTRPSLPDGRAHRGDGAAGHRRPGHHRLARPRHRGARARSRSRRAAARALRAGRARRWRPSSASPASGPWTAQYIAMRALAWPDAFPHPDVAVLKAMGETNGRRALARAEAWRPWRSYAVLHLWKSLERAAARNPSGGNHDPLRPTQDPARHRSSPSPRAVSSPAFISTAAGTRRRSRPSGARTRTRPRLRECAEQLADYFAGKRQCFDLPVAPRGTPFQQRVWREIAKVPFGETITYAELAARAGSPGSARAAGAATGRNPLAIVVPCHRIVGTDGALTGYAGGLPRKEKLLAARRRPRGRRRLRPADLAAHGDARRPLGRLVPLHALLRPARRRRMGRGRQDPRRRAGARGLHPRSRGAASRWPATGAATW